jgi:hypothetical protein
VSSARRIAQVVSSGATGHEPVIDRVR